MQVGFSYSNTESDYNDNSDRQTATDNLRFLLAFLKKFPRYVGRPLYLSGESYAGYYVPLLADQILTRGGVQAGLNLKGVLIGNGLTSRSFDALSPFTALHDRYFLADKTYATLLLACNASASALNSNACQYAANSAFRSVVSSQAHKLTSSQVIASEEAHSLCLPPLFLFRARWTFTVSLPLPLPPPPTN